MSVRDRVNQQSFESVAAEAWVSLLVAADQVTQHGEAVFARYGITGEQYNVLRILRGAHPAGYPRCDVTRRLIRRAPDVTRLLDRLERGNLVERVRSPGDARLSVARITRAGLTLLNDIDPEMNAMMDTVMAPLSEPQLRQLTRLCDALVPG